MTAQTFDSFITDQNNGQTVGLLKQACVEPEAVRSPVILAGPPGVGKTHLCHAVKNAGKDMMLCTSEMLIEALIDSLRKKRNEEAFYDTFLPFHLIVDDFDLAIFRGEAVQEVFTRLILRQKANNKLVLLCGEWFPAEFCTERLAKVLSQGQFLRLSPPGRDARILYCKKKLEELRLRTAPEEIEAIVDGPGSTVSKINSVVLNAAARAESRPVG